MTVPAQPSPRTPGQLAAYISGCMGLPKPDPTFEDALAAAEGAIAAGWRPPALVITTTEDLDALGTGAVIMDSEGVVWQHEKDLLWWADGARPAWIVGLPATVLVP